VLFQSSICTVSALFSALKVVDVSHLVKFKSQLKILFFINITTVPYPPDCQYFKHSQLMLLLNVLHCHELLLQITRQTLLFALIGVSAKMFD